MSDREIELAELFEVTDARLVEHIVVPEQIRLPDMSLSETIKNRFRNTAGAVAHGVDNGFALTREFVRVRSVFKRQPPAFGDDAAVGRDFERLAHRCAQLRRLCLVTLDAGFAADVANAVRLRVRTPVGENIVSLSISEDAHQQTDDARSDDSI